MDLRTDWGKELESLPGWGPGMEYQILLDT
jgi:hypothetical protein